MEERTRKLWERQNRHPGDRQRLFTAVGEALSEASAVLYPGSFVDVAASFVFDEVTYVDVDRRAERFFADADGVNEIVATHRTEQRPTTWRFISADYTTSLALPDEGFDLLVSLYAGFVSAHCTRFVRRGGYLLVNPSHGDAAMASIDPRYELAAVVQLRRGTYRVSDRALDTYLVPKQRTEVTAEMLRQRGRGIAYTKSPFAYLFYRTK